LLLFHHSFYCYGVASIFLQKQSPNDGQMFPSAFTNGALHCWFSSFSQPFFKAKSSGTRLNFIRRVFPGRANGQKPNCKFNVDANTGHGFAIFMASVGALRPSGSGAS
jgi:hypothetical protein